MRREKEEKGDIITVVNVMMHMYYLSNRNI